MITHSFVMAVLDSHRMFEKQARWLAGLLPDNWELIVVDDESTPPLELPDMRPKNTTLIRHLSNRQPGEWTQKEALNLGFSKSIGEYIVKSDIDHIFTAEAIAVADSFHRDMLLFERRAGRLYEDQIHPIEHSVTSPIDDVYVIRRSILQAIGGYPITRKYGDGGRALWGYSRRPEAQPQPGAPIYVCPPELETYHSVERIRGAECDRD